MGIHKINWVLSINKLGGYSLNSRNKVNGTKL